MKKILLVCLSLLLCLSGEAQEMKGRIYFNGNMSVSHLLAQKENETAEQHKERETVMNEIFTMTVTIEFLNSHDMRMKMKILMDKERAKELGVSWANRKMWQADLSGEDEVLQLQVTLHCPRQCHHHRGQRL